MKWTHRILGLFALGLLSLISPETSPEPAATENSEGCSTFGNPAAEYCKTIMGYDYSVLTAEDGGQSGVCTMPDGVACSGWDFYAGRCGQAYSWCVRNGYKLETRNDGKDPYSPEYAVCVDEMGHQVGSIASLSGLNALARESVKIPSIKIEPDSVKPKYNVDDIPTAFNWLGFLGKNWITPPKDQGECGSCWAFASVALTEAQGNIIAKDPTLNWDLAEGWLVSNWCTCDDWPCAGADPACAMAYIRDEAVPDEECYPYWWGPSVGWGEYISCYIWGGRFKRVPNVHAAYNYWDPPGYTATDLKYYISHYGPVIITLGYSLGIDGPNIYGTYYDPFGIHRCNHDVPSDGTWGINHAVLAVGYNDAGGFWIAKNSWGTDFGLYGYFAIGYGECNVEHSEIVWVESPLPYHYVHLPSLVR